MTNKRVVHVITGLSIGGAESSLVNLLCNSDSSVSHTLIVLSNNFESSYGDRLSEANIPIKHCFLPSLPYPFSFFYQLFSIFLFIFSTKPDYIISHLYWSNIVCSIVSFLTPSSCHLVWLHNHMFLGRGSFIQRLLRSVLVFLTRLAPVTAVSPTIDVFDYHVSLGMKFTKSFYIGSFIKPVLESNFVSSEFSQRHRDLTFTVGFAARFSPIKRFDKLLAVAQSFPSIRFIVHAVVNTNNTLPLVLKDLAVCPNVQLIFNSTNLTQFFSDVHFLLVTSDSESYSNVICESLASSVPIISTPVGIAAHLDSECSIISPDFSISSLIDSTRLAQSFFLDYPSVFLDMRHSASQYFSKNLSLESQILKYYSLLSSA